MYRSRSHAASLSAVAWLFQLESSPLTCTGKTSFPMCMGGKLKGSIKDVRLGTLVGPRGPGKGRGRAKGSKYLLELVFDQSRVS